MCPSDLLSSGHIVYLDSSRYKKVFVLQSKLIFVLIESTEVKLEVTIY